MSQEKQSRTGMLGSKYRKLFLVLITGLFTFGGPYAAYVLIHILELNYAVSMIFGFALFIVGLVLVWYLIRHKIVS